jgi:hypothetical protein
MAPARVVSSRRRRRRRRRQDIRLAITLTVSLLCLAAATTWVLTPHGPTTHVARHSRAAAAARGRRVDSRTPRPATTEVPSTTTTALDPGALPQTDSLPSATSAQFQSEMTALWLGITRDNPADALAAFFPEGAYLQLKTIGDAAGDYQHRLVEDFTLDIEAAHALLGTDAATATLVVTSVPGQYAHWIPPGVCDNSIGYFEVANSRLVYQEAGQTRSIGIASLISWRGEWYVVHLGAILRNTDGGVVLDPEGGPGTSPPSTTC